MVSTRAIKLKFGEGERVLCYEPDPTKAKVLYDSKVLDVVVNKDEKGKRIVEYLIHFQGWNSSWDRCVGEEFVLKDTPENRQLQRDLADKSQLHLGAYLYRKERKKHNRRTNSDKLEGFSSDSPRAESESTSSEDDSSIDEDVVSIELTPILKQILEQDYYMINSNKKLHKLPAEPNVITILELYLRNYYDYVRNDKSSNRLRSNGKTLDTAEIKKKMNLCREFLDGIRIYFDSVLNGSLLYQQETNQIPSSEATRPKDETKNNHAKENFEIDHRRLTRKRVLRSNANEAQSNGHDHAENNENSSDECVSSKKDYACSFLPPEAYAQRPAPPSLVYGATHLLRLLVKLPEYLGATTITPANLEKLSKHLDLFIRFLSECGEWYGEKCYVSSD